MFPWRRHRTLYTPLCILCPPLRRLVSDKPVGLHEADLSIRPQNHSDYVTGPIRTYGTDADVMLEAKAKEQAMLQSRRATSTPS